MSMLLSILLSPLFWILMIFIIGLVFLFRKSFHLYFIYFVGVRYLKKRFTSYVAMAGVTVGVMVLVIVLSVMGGFQQAFWERLRSSTGDLTIEAGTYFGVYDYQKIQEELEKLKGVKRSAPFIQTIVLIESTGADYGFLKGIHFEQEKAIGKFSEFLLSPRATYMKFSRFKEPPTEKDVSRALGDLLYLLSSKGISPAGEKIPEDLPPEWADKFTDVQELKKLITAFEEYWRFRRAKDYIKTLSDTVDLHKTKSGLPGVIVGFELLKRFGLQVGSTLTVTTISGMALEGLSEVKKQKIKTREQDFEVVGSIKVGIFTQDRRMLFATVPAVQKLIGLDGRVSGITLQCDDFQKAEGIKKEVEKKIDQMGLQDLYVRTWKEKNQGLFRAVQSEKLLLSILLFFIILVAGFMIFAILSMMVVEKTKDVGIIKALGSPSSGVMSIFLYQGLLIGVLGILLGLGLGLFFAHNINEVADGIHYLTGYHPFPPKIYYLDKIPIAVDYMGILIICLLTFGVSLGCALYPAYRASRFNAIQALRYE